MVHQSNQMTRLTTVTTRAACIFVACVALSMPEMYSTEVFVQPPSAQTPSVKLGGKVRVVSNDLNYREHERMQFIPANSPTLPTFDFAYVQRGSDFIPVRRGLITTTHPNFDYFLHPGKVWQNADGGTSASLPFTLMSRFINCTHNGLLTFTLGNKQPGKVLINQETCHFMKFDLWGQVEVSYEEIDLSATDDIRNAFEEEIAHRLPLKTYADFTKDYPEADLELFDTGLPKDDALSTKGIFFNGIHYADQCRTRSGPHPFCNYMLMSSFSTAKTAFASVAMMTLAQEFGLDIYGQRIMDHLPEANMAKGDWTAVTFNNTGDMTSGHYQNPGVMADQVAYSFFDDAPRKAKLAASFELPYKATPGTKMTYVTSDTFVLVAAMDAYLKRKNAPITDSFEYVVERVFKPIHLAPDVLVSRRTREHGVPNVGTAFGGYGMFWTNDAAVKVAKLMLLENGRIDGKQVLHPRALDATMQRDPLDRGLDMRFLGFWYNNGAWAFPAKLLGERFNCNPWVTVMSGVSGVRIVMMPNGLIFYYFNDAQAFPLAEQVIAADQIAPFCEG